MTCDQIQPLLDAFADGELEWGTAWRIRHHLAECSACALELAELRQIATQVRAWRDVTAPAGLQGRLAAALASALPAVTHPPRHPHIMRRTAVGLIGIAAVAAAFFWLTPGQPGRPRIAFADVERAMQQVKTVSWKTEEQTPSIPGQRSKDTILFTFTYWLRRNPPAIATTGLEVVGMIKTLIDARGAFSLSKDECDVTSMTNNPIRRTVEKQILNFTEFPQPASSSSVYQGQTTTTNFRQSSVVLNGQNEVRFDRDVKTVWIGKGRTDYQLSHVITWADPETHRIIRNEAYFSKDTPRGRTFRPYVIIQDHFRYDQTPPKGTFDWSPPAGVRVVRIPPGPAKK